MADYVDLAFHFADQVSYWVTDEHTIYFYKQHGKRRNSLKMTYRTPNEHNWSNILTFVPRRIAQPYKRIDLVQLVTLGLKSEPR